MKERLLGRGAKVLSAFDNGSMLGEIVYNYFPFLFYKSKHFLIMETFHYPKPIYCTFEKFNLLLSGQLMFDVITTDIDLPKKFTLLFIHVSKGLLKTKYYTAKVNCIVTDCWASFNMHDNNYSFSVLGYDFDRIIDKESFDVLLNGWACQEFGNRTI